MKLITTLKLSALSLLTAAACGGSGGTGVTDKPLNELTDDEFVEACETLLDEVSDDAIAGSSRYFCAVFTCDQGGTAFDDCIADSEPEPCEAPASDAPERDCALPASTLAECSLAFSEQFAAYSSATCENFETIEEPKDFAEVPECAEVVEQCPDLAS